MDGIDSTHPNTMKLIGITVFTKESQQYKQSVEVLRNKNAIL
jgi:hypothetical protein